MAKRFVLRKIKARTSTRQGWTLKSWEEYAVYDKEWKKNINEYKHLNPHSRLFIDTSDFRRIESCRSKETAQFWADWLNANCLEVFGKRIMLPGKIFLEGLKTIQHSS